MQKHIAASRRQSLPTLPRGAARILAICALGAVAALVAIGGTGSVASHAAAEAASLADIGPRDTGPRDTGLYEITVEGQTGPETIWSANIEVGKAGDRVFPLSETRDQGTVGNIHARRLEESLGRSEGETAPLSPFRLVDQITLPNPPDVDNDDTDDDTDDFMLAVYSMTGEIENSGQFDTITVTLESDKRYLVEMNGAATGDGTLSDPWISGIKGRFEVDGQPRWEPVWYDASGRTSAWVTFPNGSRYRVDENGRMFSELTGDDEDDTILRPVMGWNDDAGEGFNARLFLVNFPGGDYRVVVSGAPNPNDTGTYTFSLMEIISDDFTASSDAPGTLSVGESAVGRIEAPADVDWFAVDLEAEVNYVVEIKGRLTGGGTLPNPRFAGIYSADGTLIEDAANNERAPGDCSDRRLEFKPTSAGIHHIAVSGSSPYVPNRSALPVGTYTVSVGAEECGS